MQSNRLSVMEFVFYQGMEDELVLFCYVCIYSTPYEQCDSFRIETDTFTFSAFFFFRCIYEFYLFRSI